MFSQREGEHEAVLFFTVIVTTSFIITEGGATIGGHNHKDKLV